MENIKNYEDFVNEGLIGDTKDKILKWWNNFQNKETFLRKFSKLINNSSYGIIYLWCAIYFAQYFNLLPGIDANVNILEVIRNNDTVYYALLAIYLFLVFGSTSITRRLMNSRMKIIRDKMAEMREKFINNKDLLSYFYSVIGDKKNIEAAINKLKDDGWIDDDNVIQLEGITLIDFSGSQKAKKEVPEEIDPYGEEDWEDETPRISYHYSVCHSLEDKYNVRFRQITDEIDYSDRLQIKKAKKWRIRNDEIEYQLLLKRRDKPEEEKNRPLNDIWDEGMADYLIKQPIENKEKKKPRLKRFKDRLSNFVVPGFDVNKPDMSAPETQI